MDTESETNRRALSAKARWLLAGAGLAVVVVFAVAANHAAKAYVLDQVERRIRDVMLESRALHRYVQHDMHPVLYKLEDEGRVPQGFYAPELLSSTCIARDLFTHYNEEREKAGLPEVHYKLAAANPRNPVNEADSFERSLIEMFNADRDKTEYRDTIEIDGRKHLYYAIPFLPTEEACLKCHGDPSAAPKELQAYYNWTGGFHRQVGDIVAIESIRSPLEGEFHAAYVISAVLIVAVVLFGVILFVNSKLRALVQRHVAALSDSEGRYRSVIEDSTGLICRFLSDSTITFANEAYCKYFGRPADEFIGRKFIDLILKEDRPGVMALIESLTRDTPVRSHEHRVTLDTGEIRWQRWTNRALFDDGGQIVAYQAFGEDVTDRRQAKEALRKERDRAQMYLDVAEVMLLVLDADGRVVLINRKGCSVLGYAEHEIIGRNWFDAFLPERLREKTKLVHQQIVAGDIAPVEYHENPVLTKSGEERLIAWHNSLLRNENGDLAMSLSSGEDITERRQAEGALQESEARLRQIAETIDDVFWVTDWSDHRTLFASPAYEKVWGRSIQDLYANPSDWANAIHPDDRERAWGRFLQMAEDEVFDEEYRIIRPGGEVVWIRDRGFPIRVDDGRIERVVGIAQDITVRKKSEQALRDSEEKYRFIVENSHDVIMLTQPDGIVTYLSPACESVLGHAPADLVNTRPSITHPDDQANANDALRRALRGESGAELEYRVNTKEGRTKWVSHSWSPVTVDDRVHLIVSVLRDITERKEAEEQRHELEDQLRQAQKMEALGVLAAGVAHDLNNVLTVIMNYASIAHSGPSDKDRVEEAYERIGQAVGQATGLTRSLLTFSRRATTDKSPVHFGQVISVAVELVRRMLPAAIEIVADSPSYAPGLWIEADATQIQQVILNLAVNARDAMPDGGKLGISVSHRAVDSSDVLSAVATRGMGAAALVVEDTGEGMSEETLAHMFEPFFTTKTKERGTGLGMAIVHGIVTDHHGTIDVKSQVEHGTRIEVIFPCCSPGDSVAGPSLDDSVSHGHGETILLAEDNESVRAMVASTLRSMNYHVLDCSNGVEAMAVFESNRASVSALILDVDLPKKSGTACLDEMRNARPELPAVMVTGSSGPDLEALVDSQTLALNKPFLVTELANKLSEVINASSRQSPQP